MRQSFIQTLQHESGNIRGRLLQYEDRLAALFNLGRATWLRRFDRARAFTNFQLIRIAFGDRDLSRCLLMVGRLDRRRSLDARCRGHRAGCCRNGRGRQHSGENQGCQSQARDSRKRARPSASKRLRRRHEDKPCTRRLGRRRQSRQGTASGTGYNWGVSRRLVRETHMVRAIRQALLATPRQRMKLPRLRKGCARRVYSAAAPDELRRFEY